jgi:hypothetical protein
LFNIFLFENDLKNFGLRGYNIIFIPKIGFEPILLNYEFNTLTVVLFWFNEG